MTRKEAVNLACEMLNLHRCPAPNCDQWLLGQRPLYCSDECTAIAEREGKRKWWAEHGTKWRAKRNIKKAA